MARSMKTVIRAATIEDIPQVVTLEEQWEASNETIGLRASAKESLVSFVGHCFFVATDPGSIVGFVYARSKRNDGSMSAIFNDGDEYLELEALYVVPERRSMGIGKQLIEAILDCGNLHGIRHISAFSSTRDVDRVLRFYRSCGFESWGLQVFRSGRKSPAS